MINHSRTIGYPHMGKKKRSLISHKKISGGLMTQSEIQN